MYGDTEVARRRADRLREQGVELRALARELTARTEALGWTGRAATAMHARVADRSRHLLVAADGHDRAADALVRHARAVEREEDRIAAIEGRAAALVADAAPDDEALAGFVPPAPGHKDWLQVELPGL